MNQDKRDYEDGYTTQCGSCGAELNLDSDEEECPNGCDEVPIRGRAEEVQIGNRVSYDVDGETKKLEVVKLVRDIGCVHLWTYGPRVVTLPNNYPVEIEIASA